jgi:hypothetical protein
MEVILQLKVMLAALTGVLLPHHILPVVGEVLVLLVEMEMRDLFLVMAA